MTLILDKNCPNLEHHNPLITNNGWHNCNFVDSPEKQIKILEGKIKGDEKRINRYKLEIRQEKEKNIEKSQQIFRLNKIIEASKIIFKNRVDFIDELIKRLEKEQDENKNNEEYQKSLLERLKEINKEKNYLKNGLKNLEEQEKLNKEAKDKEITYLKKENQKLEKIIEENSEEINNLKKDIDSRPTLTFKKYLEDKLEQLEKAISSKSAELVIISEDLKKERTWLDKWQQNFPLIEFKTLYYDKKEGNIEIKYSVKENVIDSLNLVKIKAITKKRRIKEIPYDYHPERERREYEEFEKMEVEDYHKITLENFKEFLKKIREYYLNN